MKKISIAILCILASTSFAAQRFFTFQRLDMVPNSNDIIAVNAAISSIQTGKVSYTDSVYTSTVAKASTALQVQNFNYGDLTNKPNLSIYATGTPLYVESDPAWHSGTGAVWTAIDVAKTNDASQLASLNQSITNLSGDIQTLEDVTNSYVIVDGNKFSFYSMVNSRPAYLGPNDSFLSYSDDAWRLGRPFKQTNASGSFLPPLTGWLIDGVESGLDVQFFSGTDAQQQAQIDEILTAPTNRTSATIGGFYTDGTNETLYIRRN